MGKTFRRGGNERGYYSPGKSIRDKRAKGGTNRSNWGDNYDDFQPKKNKRKFDPETDNDTGWYWNRKRIWIIRVWWQFWGRLWPGLHSTILMHNETPDDKFNRGLDLFMESVIKPDDKLRSCAHNQKCYHELMYIRAYVLDYLKTLRRWTQWLVFTLQFSQRMKKWF